LDKTPRFTNKKKKGQMEALAVGGWGTHLTGDGGASEQVVLVKEEEPVVEVVTVPVVNDVNRTLHRYPIPLFICLSLLLLLCRRFIPPAMKTIGHLLTILPLVDLSGPKSRSGSREEPHGPDSIRPSPLFSSLEKRNI
jgi:hypothetical protein